MFILLYVGGDVTDIDTCGVSEDVDKLKELGEQLHGENFNWEEWGEDCWIASIDEKLDDGESGYFYTIEKVKVY